MVGTSSLGTSGSGHWGWGNYRIFSGNCSVNPCWNRNPQVVSHGVTERRSYHPSCKVLEFANWKPWGMGEVGESPSHWGYHLGEVNVIIPKSLGESVFQCFTLGYWWLSMILMNHILKKGISWNRLLKILMGKNRREDHTDHKWWVFLAWAGFFGDPAP